MGFFHTLSLCCFFTTKVSMRIDEELKGEVQTELMKAMLKYEIKVK